MSALHSAVARLANPAAQLRDSTQCDELTAQAVAITETRVELRREDLDEGRRRILCGLLGAGTATIVERPALAASLGFPGMKNWLQGQKQKSMKFLLAPVEASRDRLDSVRLLLSNVGFFREELDEARRLVKVASRDCVPATVGTLIGLQSKTGVQVCTFKLVLKNASSLLDDDDPNKVMAERRLQNLQDSLASLDSLLEESVRERVDRERVEKALDATMLALDDFESGVRACLGVP